MNFKALVACALGLLLWVGKAATATTDPQPQTPLLLVSEREGFKEIIVRTKLAEYLFLSRGGLLKSVYLYFAPIGVPALELIPDTETSLNPQTGSLKRSYVRGALFPFRLVVDGRSTDELNYSFESERASQQLLLRFRAEVSGLEITKTFLITENPYYTLDLKVEFKNMGDAPIEPGVQLFLGHGVGRSADSRNQIRYLFGGRIADRLRDAPGFEGLGFVGGGLIFFLKGFSGNGPISPIEGQATGHESGLGLEIKPLSLAPGGSKSLSFELYAGRAKYTLLARVGLGQLDPPGFFAQFLVAVVWLLDWLYGATGNYGYAILLFTLLTRILLFPLMRQQFHSMAKLAELRPKLERLQQRYPTLRRLKELHPHMSQEELLKRDRENRRALQEKLMELYREERVNPLGGCLPLLIQFPILIILWQAILYSAETIHLSSGFLWMPDLSLHDPYYLIVALTALAMILQAKTMPTAMTTSTQGPNQWVFMLFSIALMVLFLKDFPSGLWLYYLLTTVFQVGQQVFINWELKRIRLKKEAALPEPSAPQPSQKKP